MKRCIFIFLFAFAPPGHPAPPDPAAPRVTGIYSPKRTILLQAGKTNRLLRVAEVLPVIPFSLFSRVNDMVEVTFPDGSIVRQGPNTLVEYVPAANQVAVMGGSILVRFGKEPSLQVSTPEIQGKDCVLMLTLNVEGAKVISLSGKAKFREITVEEGEMYFLGGQSKLQGPFMIDLAELVRSSSLTVEFPGNRWVKESTDRPIDRQKWMKNLGLVGPSETMLEGGSARVKSVTPPQPPPAAKDETQSRSK
ncbi:MAG: FecR domain-containing protein [Verrucomicrobia bacterium]|nr:FecR domain-containing protein [Verrucomicrobiota bacterium]